MRATLLAIGAVLGLGLAISLSAVAETPGQGGIDGLFEVGGSFDGDLAGSDLSDSTRTKVVINSAESLNIAGQNLFIENASSRFYFGASADSGNAPQLRIQNGQFLILPSNSGGKSLVLSDGANRNRNHDHGAQTNPTLFVHSITDPDTNNTQWASITHDQTDAYMEAGLGDLGIGFDDATNARVNIRVATELLSDISADANANGLVPDGAFVIGVSARVTTTITCSGCAAWTVGDGSDVDLWGSNSTLTAGATLGSADFTATGAAGLYTSANDVVISPDAGSFTAGAVRLVVHYFDVTAPDG